jgi:hypothetical protein
LIIIFETKFVWSTCFFSPDRSGKPLESKAYFFLIWQSDQRKLLPNLRKKGFAERDCSEERDGATKR